MALNKIRIELDGNNWAPAGIAAPAILVGDWLFISGQVAVDRTGTVSSNSLYAQTDQVFETVRMLCEAAGGSADDLIDVAIFTSDPRDLPVVADRARSYLGSAPPAVTFATFADSYGSSARVMVQAVAHVGKGEKNCYMPDPLGWAHPYPMSGGCEKDGILFVSGQLPCDANGNIVAHGDHCGQARQAYANMLTVVEAAGGSVHDIIDFTSFHQDIRGADATLQTVYGPDVLGPVAPENLAATSHVGVPGLLIPGALGCYRAIADLAPGPRLAYTPDETWWKGVLPVAGGSMKKEGRLIAVAGQVASGQDGAIVASGDYRAQARFVLSEMQDVLAGFDCSLDDVVVITSFHKDMRSWPEVHEIAREMFGDDRRAWTAVGVTGLWMEGYLHEISALALAT